MPSEAARDRALRRGPGALGFLLAHHWPGHLDRCYLAWIGRRPVWFCARCTGLYPALLLVLAAQPIFGIPTGWWDWLWLYLLALPAVIDWSAQRLADLGTSNKFRTFTGALLGVALGRSIYLNMTDPANTLVVIQFAGLAVVVVMVELFRYKRYRSRTG